MNPEEKAEILIKSFIPFAACETGEQNWINAKQCALIAVNLRLDSDFVYSTIEYSDDSYEFWDLVKSELEKL